MKRSVLAVFLGILLGSLKAYSGQAPNSPDTSSSGQPLRLQNFRARLVSSNQVELSWLTAETWTNVTHYEMQRSLNNRDFISTGTILQTSNAPLDQQYAYTDQLGNTAGITTVYYRLRQVNRDGRESFSFVLPVKLQQETAMTIWPNPAVQEAVISFNTGEAGLVTVAIFDMSGHKVIEKHYQSGRGLNMIKIEEVRNLNAGVHIVQVRVGNTITGTGKLVKQLR